MIPPIDTKIMLYLVTKHPSLGLLRTGEVYQLVLLDELRIDPGTMDIYADTWAVTFEEFAIGMRIFDHDAHPELLRFYPNSQNPALLADIWRQLPEPDPKALASYIKMFKHVQHGRMTKA